MWGGGGLSCDQALQGPGTALCFLTFTGTSVVWTGHTDRVLSVAFSPDGLTALSGSADNTIRQWNVATGVLEAGPGPEMCGLGPGPTHPLHCVVPFASLCALPSFHSNRGGVWAERSMGRATNQPIYRARDDFSQPPCRTRSQNTIFTFVEFWGPADVRGSLCGDLGCSLLWVERGGGASQGALTDASKRSETLLLVRSSLKRWVKGVHIKSDSFIPMTPLISVDFKPRQTLNLPASCSANSCLTISAWLTYWCHKKGATASLCEGFGYRCITSGHSSKTIPLN